MSRGGDGSDFSDGDGAGGGGGSEYLRRREDPVELQQSAKRLKLGERIGDSSILSLHTDWVHREAGDRAATAYVGGDPNDGPIPVPQSDFEIEINSTGQEGGGGSPSHDGSISLTSASITIEPRIMTIDAGLSSCDNVTTTSSAPPIQKSLPVSSHHLREVVEEEEDEEDDEDTSISVANLSAQASQLGGEIPVSMVNTSLTQSPDFTALMASAKSGLLQVPTDQQSLLQQHGDITGGGQFIQAAGDGTGAGGPLYVMIPPTTNSADLLQAMQQGQTQRPLMPRLSTGALAPSLTDDGRKHKELIRKQTHNEVERRRRDRINELIKILAEVVPGCQKKDSSNGNIVGYVYSKGTVLEKTVEYVRELMLQNEQLAATAKLAEKSASAISILQNQITVLEKENTFLRAQMVQLGIDASPNALGNARSLLSNPLAQSLLNTQVTPPPPPPAPPANTSQLLVSLAQTLTNNPLLASLAQANTSTPVTPGVPNENPVVTSSGQPVPSNSQAAMLMNSLVQTLATIANSNTPTPPPPPPPPQSSGLSASAAMSLLNSLMMAQSALSATTTHTTQAVPLSSHPPPTPTSLLVSPHAQDNKVTPPM